jgi:hypothetical protein
MLRRVADARRQTFPLLLLLLLLLLLWHRSH